MNRFFFLIFLIFPTMLSAQITGRVTNPAGEPMPYVTIHIENTYVGTATNVNGEYTLKINKTGTYTVVFKRLGYKTQRINLTIDEIPFKKDISMEDENYEIEEVLINNQENPADRIIRKAIAQREFNSSKNDKFHADYYSKGHIKLKDLPKFIKNRQDKEIKELLDTANSGYLYLSETFSKITFQKPNKLYENIIASKISGNDQGYSYNTALGSSFDFYTNYLNITTNVVSPLADIAFTYYKYQLESSFQSEDHTIYKIKVIAKRDKEPVVEGYIYIVDESYEIYAVDFNVKGYRINTPMIDQMQITQYYSYNKNDRFWVKSSQFINFEAGILGITFNASFASNFSNYQFVKEFDKNTFGKVVVNIEKDANKLDSTFWVENRPIPLLTTESKDYIKKDSLQKIRTSPAYIDSVDRAHNKFKLADIALGYNYKHTPSNTTIDYSGIFNISSLNFNPVQGWNAGVKLSARKGKTDEGALTSIETFFRYGEAEEKLRINGSVRHRFNTINYSTIELSAGNSALQFNRDNPIHPFVNMITALLQKKNYMKLYESNYARVQYSGLLTSDIKLQASFGYENRRPLFNNTNYSFVDKDQLYASNHPLVPEEYLSAPFTPHSLFKLNVGAVINFGSKIIQRPYQKIIDYNDKYPTLRINYTQALGATISNYNYARLEANAKQDLSIGNKGTFQYNLTAGKFFNSSNIAFMDYKHFNGNEVIAVVSKPAIESFLLMPYYTFSNNDAYFESHLIHNFKGFIMNKIPLLNALQWHLNIGHNLLLTKQGHYQEFTAGFSNIGWGKYRLLKVNYVRSYNTYPNARKADDGIVFSFNF